MILALSSSDMFELLRRCFTKLNIKHESKYSLVLKRVQLGAGRERVVHLAEQFSAGLAAKHLNRFLALGFADAFEVHHTQRRYRIEHVVAIIFQRGNWVARQRQILELLEAGQGRNVGKVFEFVVGEIDFLIPIVVIVRS